MNFRVRFRLVFLFVFLVLLVFGFSFVGQSAMPDYVAYEVIYENGLSYLLLGWEPFYILLNVLGSSAGLDYDSFRLTLTVISSLFFFGAVRKSAGVLTPGSLLGTGFFNVTAVVVLVASLFFEFYIVRLRGGLSASIALLSASLMLRFICDRRLINAFLSLIFILMSYFTHAATAVTMIFFMFVPLLLIYKKYSFENYLTKTILFLLALYMIFSIGNLSGARGDHLASPLNFYRYISISIMPVVIYKLCGLFIGKRLIFKNTALQFSDASMLAYIMLAVALIPLYWLGIADQSGEALVRFFTVSTVVAAYFSVFDSGRNLYVWFYIGFVNSLFFINTVFNAKG